MAWGDTFYLHGKVLALMSTTWRHVSRTTTHGKYNIAKYLKILRRISCQFEDLGC